MPEWEADAAWRTVATARIEKIRKGPLAIAVVDAQGKPLQNAAVAVRMLRHGFRFGSAVAGDLLLTPGDGGDKYRKFITDNFTVAVIENDLKWPDFEGQPQVGQDAVAWLNTQHIPVRGHNLIWPSWRNSPERLQKLQGDKVALQKAVDDHIALEAGDI